MRLNVLSAVMRRQFRFVQRLLNGTENGDAPMKILIIHLPSQIERLAFQEKQMERLGLAFDWLPATEASSVNEATYTQLAYRWERPLRKSEVSCFLSHQLAWQQVLDTQTPTLILEDDALLADTVPALLQSLQSLTDIDLVTLENRGRKKILGTATLAPTDQVKLLPLYQDRTGAAGYVLWPSGATKLMNKVQQGHVANADAFISSHYALRSYQAEPTPVIQIDMCAQYGLEPPIATQSSIGLTERPPVAGAPAWVYKGRRIASQWRIGMRILSVVFRAKRRYAALEREQFFTPSKALP